jgi:outer membrane protein
MKNYFFILFLSLSLLSFGQQKWTLKQSLKYAHEHNLQLKQQQLSIEQAKINKTAAIASFAPSLNANASASWNNGLTQNFTTGILENQTTFGGSGSVNSNLNLFNGFKNHYTYKKSLLDILSAQYQYADLLNNIDMQIASAYIQILLNKENLESAKVQLENSIQQKERTLEMVKIGILPEGDLADVEAQITNDHFQVIQAENNYELSKINLAQLLELNDFTNFDIDEQIEGLNIDAKLMTASPEDLFEQALQTNNKLKQSQTQEAIAQYQIKLAQSAYLPSLSAFANINTRYSDRDNIGFGGMSTPADPFWNQVKDNKGISYGLNLRIPVLNGLNVRNQVKRAKLSKESVSIATYNAKKQLRSDIYKMQKDLIAAFQSMKAAEANLKAQRKAYDYGMEKFKVGF